MGTVLSSLQTKKREQELVRLFSDAIMVESRLKILL